MSKRNLLLMCAINRKNSKTIGTYPGSKLNWQECLDEHWFKDEAILAVGAEDKVGLSAYFIPERRINMGKCQHIKIS